MNDELKEILEKLKDNIPIEECRSEGTSDGLTHYEEDEDSWQYKLLDYITNLQKENEDLREENKEAHDFDETLKDIKENLIARINRQDKEIAKLEADLEMYKNGVFFSSQVDELQERIDKAIEYIKDQFCWDELSLTKLVDILEGVNNENSNK